MQNDIERPGGLSSCGSSQQAVSLVPASIPDAATLSKLLNIIRQGHWQASVYHAPPNRKYPRGGIMCGTSIILNGQYKDRESALKAARQAIAQGRVSIGQFIHGPSATPYARFSLGQEHVEALAICAQGMSASGQDAQQLEAKPASPVHAPDEDQSNAG